VHTYCIIAELLPLVDYCRQGGYIFVVCLSVSNFAQKNVQMRLHEIFREGWQWVNEQVIKFGGDIDPSGSWIRIRIAAPVRRASAEVCTVPVF